MKPHIQAKLEHNVHVIVGKPRDDGTIEVSTDKRFKNTATRLMTESICEYLAGDENSYNRGHGRPNFIGFGTMGIKEQGNLNSPILEPQFEDTNPPAQDRTRPWFESTSLALTDTCGAAVTVDGVNPHFWNPEFGWGTPSNPGKPVFEGELCTAMPSDKAGDWKSKGWDIIQRVPILRADVISDCPQDLDYGVDGYSSAVIFYGYASVLWVNKLLNPKQKNQKAQEGDPVSETVGPQLDRMAISEFGLYEKNNTDPHGLHTLLAGFRVPTAEDIVYVSKNEVILVEWRVTVRALMPYELVGSADTLGGYGISIRNQIIDPYHIRYVAFASDTGSQMADIIWEVEGNRSHYTAIDSSGLLTIDTQETASRLIITARMGENSNVSTSTIINISLIANQMGISAADRRPFVTQDGNELTVHLWTESPGV